MILKNWGLIEWAIALGFGVPIVVLCIAFVVLGGMMMAIDRKENSTW